MINEKESLRMSLDSERVCVVVLGDFGRSPRMQYHSLSLAECGYKVDVVGYGGSQPFQSVLENENIAIHNMKDVPDFSILHRTLGYIFKLLWQGLILSWTLFFLRKPDHLILQVPPSVPALFVVWYYCLCFSVNFIVDWHNYGYSIFQLKLGEKNILVEFYKWIEFKFGVKAKKHLCVTKALQQDLKTRAGIDAVVLYDRPPEHFKTYKEEDLHDMFKRLSFEYKCFSGGAESTKTAFTEENEDGCITFRKDRPVIVISSTSWTEDEDISLLIFALEAYDVMKNVNEHHYPDIVCVITGKGPLKEHYQRIIDKKQFRHVTFCLPWLIPEDYPKLLAAADVGISLHASSSGFDLPMKVVDMFGCGLPVLALNFNCLNELVKHDENGLVFSNAEQLTVYLQELFHAFPDKKRLEGFKQNLKPFQQERWKTNWETFAKPLFNVTINDNK